MSTESSSRVFPATLSVPQEVSTPSNLMTDWPISDEDQAQAAVIHRATEVIGDRTDAMRWLGTPVRALNYATPISLLHDCAGRDAVLTVLGRIEHGVL